jgi:hypothetical protein
MAPNLSPSAALVALILLALSPSAAGQDSPSSPPPADHLLGMAWLAGTWEGDGWMQMGPDRVERFRRR